MTDFPKLRCAGTRGAGEVARTQLDFSENKVGAGDFPKLSCAGTRGAVIVAREALSGKQ